MTPRTLATAALVVGSFALGILWRPASDPLNAAEPSSAFRPDLQGREPPTPPGGRNRRVAPPPGPTPTTPGTTPFVYSGEDSQSASADGMIAVTGSYGVGTSVLYIIDTRRRQLAVYEARGGTNSMRRITLVGARNIDLDLRLEGYNDESEYSFSDLERMFAGRGGSDATGKTEAAPAAPPAETPPDAGRSGADKR